MNLLTVISNLIIPILVFTIVATALMAGVPVYEEFLKGARDGMKTVVGIMPTMIGLMVGVGILRASGFLEFIGKLMGDLTGKVGFPSCLVPLTLVKMFSSSAATGLLLDIYKQFGVDSKTGLMASLMMSSTETIFYTMSVYFLAAGVTKTKWTLTGAIIATMAGTIASVYLVAWM